MKKQIYVVKAASLSESERALAVSLQGLLAQKGRPFLIDCDHYLDFIDRDRFSVSFVFLRSLIEESKELISGYVLYDFEKCDGSLNAASMLTSAKGLLAVPSSSEDLVKGILKCCRDLRQEDPISIQERIFDECLPLFNKDGLIHQVEKLGNHKTELRDYGIRNHWAIVYCDESDKGRAFLAHVLSSLNSNIAIYGWTTDEISFVETISHYGDCVIPSDWSSNRSFFASSEEKSFLPKPHHEAVLPNKHYVALEVSDGDNSQWLEREFAFEGYYGERLSTTRNYPLAFTISPSLCYLNPSVLNYIYSKAKNETFASGVSGFAYMNPCAFPKEKLPMFVDKTAHLMAKEGLSVVTLLDNKKYMDEKTIARVVEEYAKHPEIKAGVWEIDPICYRGGAGKIYFSKTGKPFVTVRFSLWSPSGERVSDRSWIDEIANKINQLPIAPDSEEGYSIINIHPWSTTNDDIDYLVNHLNNNVQILPLDDLLSQVTAKIKRS